MEGDRSVAELKGIIPNSFAHIFGHIFRKADSDLAFLVRVSYLEIYNEEVRDLLGKDQNLRLEVKERPDIGVYVKVINFEQLFFFLIKCTFLRPEYYVDLLFLFTL